MTADPPLQQRFADEMGRLLGPDFPSDIGLAVSGGGDSMAMLYLAHNWTHHFGVRLWVATVDHGLRPESASEAFMVAEECRILGWPHATLRWVWDHSGNVQDAARRARLELLDRWRGGVKHVLFAHSLDDQAETVIMRLMRGSGVDGLAGMRASRDVVPNPIDAMPLSATECLGDGPDGRWTPGYRIVRPCLGMSRADLRHYARVLKGRWVDDPTNQDDSFARVRVRKMLALLQQDGLSLAALAETAQRMTRARDALQARLVGAVRDLSETTLPGQVLLDRDGFAALDTETQMRLLTSALCYVASSEYRPRAQASDMLLDHILSGKGGTLHGARVIVGARQLRVVRDTGAVHHRHSPLGSMWDGQWHIEPTHDGADANAIVRMLGEDGWRQWLARVDRPVPVIPHNAALSLPAVWQNATLMWCPLWEDHADYRATRYVLGRRDTGFEAFCLSH
ncbi:tRNA lysidine(34) synthetase TilS [Marivita sp. S0852]|uniref:tRNA lysidine(34) synthetase TilS n=1 Tax=Marivita sp. S0852 TaxID=3373893 RepID=UPI003982A368